MAEQGILKVVCVLYRFFVAFCRACIAAVRVERRI